MSRNQEKESRKSKKSLKGQLRAGENLATRKSRDAQVTKITEEMSKTDEMERRRVRMFTRNRDSRLECTCKDIKTEREAKDSKELRLDLSSVDDVLKGRYICKTS